MSEKSGFGKSSRNEGYKDNRQYGRSRDGERRPADSRGKGNRQQTGSGYAGAGIQDKRSRDKTKNNEGYSGQKPGDRESFGRSRPKYAEGLGKTSAGKRFNKVMNDRYDAEFDKENQSSDSLGDLDKLEGRNSVMEALKAGRSINRIFVAKGDRDGSISQIVAIARQKHILIQEIDRTKLDSMSVTHSHQGVIALTAAKDYVEVEDILEKAAASGRPPFIIILDELTDPYNLGSILRTANAAGVHGVIIPKRRAIGLTSAVSKASAGAIEYVPVARVTNIVQTIEYLKKQNIWVVGTDATGEESYFDRDLTGSVALVVGSEGEGMGKLVRESCDFVVNIPMMGQISSLNAAVAGAIVTYEIFRQRSKNQH